MSASSLLELTRPVNWPRMRPRFIVEVSCGADRVMDALRDATSRERDWLDASFSERHGNLRVCEGDRRFWSTHLGLAVEGLRTDAGDDAGRTRVLGVFSPRPDIWTAYVFVIGTLTAIGAFGAMWGIVQLSMGDAPWALLVPVFTALVAALVYTSTLVGQGLALGEMYRLRRHVDECLADAEGRALRALRDTLPSV